jgi:hypothetical protein
MGQTYPHYAAALSGIGSLGDDSTTLADCGYSSEQIATIVSAHNSGALSDEGYQAILTGRAIPCIDPGLQAAGQWPIDDAALQSYLLNDPGFPTQDKSGGSSPGTPSSGPAAPPAGVPTGTVLNYQATLSVHWFASDTIGSFLSALAGALPNVGLTVANSNYSATISTFNIQLQLVVTGAGFGKAIDAQQQVDHAIWQQRGEMPMSSNISVGGSVGSGGTHPGGASDITSWLEQNMTMILLALGAIVIFPAVIKKL